LSVGLISVLTDIIWRITIAWNAGNIACKVIRFLQCVVTYSSTYVLVALSIDRYDAITHPMNFSGSCKRARLLVAVAWVISAIFSVPILILYHETAIEGRLQCWIEFSEQWQWQLYMTLVAVILFVVPALIISACYTVIVSTIWSKSKQMTPDPNRRLRRASSRGIIPKAKVKTVKMTFVIVFATKRKGHSESDIPETQRGVIWRSVHSDSECERFQCRCVKRVRLATPAQQQCTKTYYANGWNIQIQKSGKLQEPRLERKAVEKKYTENVKERCILYICCLLNDSINCCKYVASKGKMISGRRIKMCVTGSRHVLI
ncbi:hypothetical protein Cfor_04642, partial [Coptotermes formosanus]